jgi:hypothetical protein
MNWLNKVTPIESSIYTEKDGYALIEQCYDLFREIMNRGASKKFE